MLSYSVPNSGLPVPIKIKTDVSFDILIDKIPICDFGGDKILCSRPVDMDQHSIKNVKNPADRLDAVNKAYADHIKYKTSSNIRNAVMTDHILFTFLAAKAFASGNIKICEMWVERLVDEWIATSSPMFATAWPGFHKFSRVSSLITFFTGSPTSGWTAHRLYKTTMNLFKHNRRTSFLTACCNIEFSARELCHRVLRPGVVISSVMPASYVVEFYDRVL